MLVIILFMTCFAMTIAFRPNISRKMVRSDHLVSMSIGSNFMASFGQLLADTSIGEEEVLSIQGTTSDLPDPVFAVGIAAVLFIGVGALQFTLGDLNKEEGQARVRDFLATRRDTERKRGYFD